MSSVSFTVRGLPAPQGSKRAIVNRYTHRAAVVESSKRVRPWRADVREAAITAMGDPVFMLKGAVHVAMEFRLPRPKGHYGSGRNAGKRRAGAPEYPAVKPDIDKLARAVLDAITGIVLDDDAQVVQLHVAKLYASDSSDTRAWFTTAGLMVTATEFA